MSLVVRQQLGLAVTAGMLGVVIALVDRRGPLVFRVRAVGLVGAVAVLLGVRYGSVRPLAGALVALLLVLPGDDEDGPVHPLGPWALPLAVASMVGVWASVPDVEPALATGSALAPLALVRAVDRRTVGRIGTGVLVVLVVAVAALGANSRAVVVAAAATVGMVLVAPLVAGFRPSPLRGGPLAVMVATQVVAVPAARLAVRQPAGRVVLIAAVTLLVEVVMAALCVRWADRTTRRTAP